MALSSAGLVKVSAAAGLVFEGTLTFRKAADNLEAAECVLAVAQGRSEEQTYVLAQMD